RSSLSGPDGSSGAVRGAEAIGSTGACTGSSGFAWLSGSDDGQGCSTELAMPACSVYDMTQSARWPEVTVLDNSSRALGGGEAIGSARDRTGSLDVTWLDGSDNARGCSTELTLPAPSV